MVTISDQNLKLLEAVKQKTGMSKSAQIQSLISKYLASEYSVSWKGEAHKD